jgi:hypothetical protein
VIAVNHVDGNAVRGALSLALEREASTIMLACRTCGDRDRVAQTRVYLRSPGTVICSPACEIVLVERPRRLQLTLMDLRSQELT